MKKLFIIETSKDKQWEFNTGFHIVSAESPEEAKEIIKDNLKKIGDKKILSVTPVDTMLANTKYATIINSAEM